MPFREIPDGLKVKDSCRMPNIGVEPKHPKSVRMVGRGVLIQPESGLSILRQPHLNEPFSGSAAVLEEKSPRLADPVEPVHARLTRRWVP